MLRASRRRGAAAAAVLMLSCPVVASAQGNGHGHGLTKHQTTSTPSAAGAPAVTGGASGFRSFATWLDDASVLPEGQGQVSIGFGYWRTPAYSEFDVPSVDGGLGLNRRVQFGFSVPYFRANAPVGPFVRGVGDVYLSGKVQLRDPSARHHPLGVAVIPVVEILSYAPEPGASRASWALPVSVELQREGWRAYGSAGYFSRGSVFASGALELSLSDRAWLTGSLSQSHWVRDETLDPALAAPRTRTDVSGGLTVAVTRTLSAYGSVGRTLSAQQPDAATLAISGGVAFAFGAWR